MYRFRISFCTFLHAFGNRFLLRFVGILLLLAGFSSVYAVVPQRILGQPLPIDSTIASFNKYIDSGRLHGLALAQRYLERGNHYGKLWHFDKAISDYTSAIELNPQLTDAYIDRAVAYARLEKYNEAFNDLNQALHLDSNNLRAYVTRGTLNFLVGKYDMASADFKRYLKLNPRDIYRMLWLFLSEKYHDRNAETDVQQFSRNVNLDEWPGAILKLYLDEVDADAVMTALAKGVPDMDTKHACEAYFYLAQYFLLQNDRTKALELFNKAVATQAKTYVEYEFAVAYSLKLQH